MKKNKQSVISFAYVYVMYYYDLNADSMMDRMHQVQPVVFTSMRRCQDLLNIKAKGVELVEIDSDHLWRAGNYWIQREAVIDSYDHGLEFEVRDSYGVTRTGRMPLDFHTDSEAS